MAQVFGFNEAELKLLLVAVRNTRRMFQRAQETAPDANVETFQKMYDALYEKLLDMAGPLPEGLDKLL